MFDRTDISQMEYSSFYHGTCGAYEACLQMIEGKNKELIEAQKDYKEFKIEYYKKQIKILKDRIKELESEKKILEFLYNSTFNRD